MRDKRREKCRNHKQHEDGGKSNGESTFLGVIQWANRFYVNFIFSAQRRGKTIMRIFAKHYSQHPTKTRTTRDGFVFYGDTTGFTTTSKDHRAQGSRQSGGTVHPHHISRRVTATTALPINPINNGTFHRCAHSLVVQLQYDYDSVRRPS